MSELTLLVLRHAKSSWKDSGLGDHLRPLESRGRRDAPRMGELLTHLDLTPDMIVSSTARRTRETVEAVVPQLAPGGEVVYDEALYLADPATIIDVIWRHGAGRNVRLMIVGHNPGAERLVYKLTGEDETLPTAALACIDLPIETWTDLRVDTAGRLRGLWRPKELR